MNNEINKRLKIMSYTMDVILIFLLVELAEDLGFFARIASVIGVMLLIKIMTLIMVKHS